MPMRVFLAGASGVIGTRMTPLLREAGYEVFGMTREADKAEALRAAGAIPVIVDVFDASALSQAVNATRPDVVIHQLTALPPGLDPNRMAEAIPRNARIRSEGTRNLVAAARGAGARRLIAQSVAWAYAPGREPHVEDDPLDVESQGPRAVTVRGVATLEELALGAAPIEGIVLRYGHLYGPGTGSAAAGEPPTLHVDAAAWAAVAAIERGQAGIYNVADENRYVSVAKARRELLWEATFRHGGRC